MNAATAQRMKEVARTIASRVPSPEGCGCAARKEASLKRWEEFLDRHTDPEPEVTEVAE